MNPDHCAFDRLGAAAAHAERAAPSVSAWSVGEHVHHVCLSMIGIVRALEKSTPPKPPSGFSVERTSVLVFGYIPRGRARCPEPFVPRASVPPAELLALIDESARQVERARTLDRRVWFRHPLLGPLDRSQALRFIGVHNRHHLRIVTNIVRAKS